MRPRLKQIKYLRISSDSRDGHDSSPQRFAHNPDVWFNPFPVGGKTATGSSKSGLDLIRYSQHLLALTQSKSFSQISSRRDNDSSFALYRLYKKSSRIWRNGLLQRFNISIGNNPESRCERSKIFFVLRRRRKGRNRQSSSMKVTRAYDNLGLIFRYTFATISPSTHRLHRSLHRFRSCIHGENLRFPREL
ncbi:hypothetical protein D3C76_1174070 [compost metagenome]